MNKKIFYFDIDGTLATHQGITDSNIQVLQALHKLGHHVVIASGRPAWYVKKMFNGLIDGLISSNGRHIEFNNKVLLDDFLSIDTLHRIVAICNEVKCAYLLVSKEDTYVGNKEYGYYDHGYQPAKEEYTLDTLQIYMFDIFYQSPAHFLKIKEAFKDFIILNDHHVGSADASTMDVNKGTAVTALTKHVGLKKEDSFAFGDGDNDIDMFKAVGHSIAMNNGSPLAKETAQYITANIEEEGIKKALLKYQIL